MTAQRHRLPLTRNAIVHKFSVGNVEGYIIVGLYPDGRTGNKEIPTASSIIDYLFHWLELQFLSGEKQAA